MARVLVVENDPGVAEGIGRLLESLGHVAVHEADGLSAYQRLVKEEEDFDLLMVDLHMPGMPGKALIEKVEPLLQGVTPVIAMSGKPYYLEALGPLAKRLAAVLEKPRDICLEPFKEQVAKALALRQEYVAARLPLTPGEKWRRKAEILSGQYLDLYREARLDPMTGLPTRRALADDFDWLSITRGEHRGAIVLALVDIDGFRRFNRELGYEGGDAVIRHLAQVLQRSIRDGDTLYRYGGDEFVLLLQAEDLPEGARAVRRLQECVAAAPELVLEGRNLGPITFSAGLDFHPAEQGPSIARMLEVANARLREAKAAGGKAIRPVLDRPAWGWGPAVPLRGYGRIA